MNPSLSIPRRHTLTALLTALVPLLALLLVAAPGVDAARSWCRTDPVISINGQIADIIVMAPVEDLPKITGATQVVVVVPVGVDAKLIAKDAGFGYGEDVSFQQSNKLRATATKIDVIVRVYVPATSSTVPIRVLFIPRSTGLLSPITATGTANSWVVLKSAV